MAEKQYWDSEDPDAIKKVEIHWGKPYANLYKDILENGEETLYVDESTDELAKMVPSWKENLNRWPNLFPICKRLEDTCGVYANLIAQLIVRAYENIISREEDAFVATKHIGVAGRRVFLLNELRNNLEVRIQPPDIGWNESEDDWLERCDRFLLSSMAVYDILRSRAKPSYKGSLLDAYAFYLVRLLGIGKIRGQEAHDFAQSILSSIAPQYFPARYSSDISIRSAAIRVRVARYKKYLSSKPVFGSYICNLRFINPFLGEDFIFIIKRIWFPS